jgi:hypothetical protein
MFDRKKWNFSLHQDATSDERQFSPAWSPQRRRYGVQDCTVGGIWGQTGRPPFSLSKKNGVRPRFPYPVDVGFCAFHTQFQSRMQ